MDVQNNSMTQTKLLLNHIISTFNAKLGMLWIAGTDTFYTSTQNGGHTVVNTNSLVSFLAGYYYRSMRIRNRYAPYIIENLVKTPNIPENLLKLAEIENIKSIFILPIHRKKHVKGVLIFGSDNANNFSNINFDLLRLLVDAALHFDDKNVSDLQIHDPEQHSNSFGLIVGRSSQMQDIYKTIIKISQSDANVFIYGESGTGKKLIARTIHAQSRRKDAAFIPIDCVALPKSLLESELFGYEKGAFTGANNIKQGLIEYANKGTFFLDEITEMNYDLQSKLLRVLQERHFRRLGGKRLIDIDIRIISATNLDPQKAISNKILREDFFYRLNVIPIHLLPLRDRKEDVPLLIEHFLKEFSNSNESKCFSISEEALQFLLNYNWPGNVRELKTLIERVITLAKHEIITVEDLPVEIVTHSSSSQSIENNSLFTLPYNQAKEQNLMTFERLYFSRLLDRYNGNITKVC